MTRTEWAGPLPLSGGGGVHHWREIDDDGSEYYVATDARGEIAERCLVNPEGALKAVRDAARVQRVIVEARAARIQELRAKRGGGLPLTPRELEEVIDHLLGVNQ